MIYVSATPTTGLGTPENPPQGFTKPVVFLLLVCVGGVIAINFGDLLLHLVFGVLLLVVLPAALLVAKVNWPAGIRLAEAVCYSVALVVLAVILGGLALNEALPWLGVERPLDRVPVTVAMIVGLTGLVSWRADRWRPGDGVDIGGEMPVVGLRDQMLLVAGALVLAGSVCGAIRLNNDSTGVVTIAMLIVSAAVVVALLWWRSRIRESTIIVTIYLLGAAMLLMTSMRGWFITGHDIQREYRVLELTSEHGVWSIDRYQDAYNACLSVTILPTIVERVTGIDALYVYKTIFQILYALSPVLIYLISRRFSTRVVAILAACYFIAFPTFFTDMPFLNRQEMAFLFLGVAVLVATDDRVRLRTRRVGFTVFGVGIILSHYSTTYVLLGVLVLAWLVLAVPTLMRKVIARRTRRSASQHRKPRAEHPPLVVNAVVIFVLGLLTVLWVGPLTGTGGVIEETFTTTVDSLKEFGTGQRSADASYSIFGGTKPQPEERLRDYKTDSLDQANRARAEHDNYPLDEVSKYPTPLVAAASLPVTTLGHAVERTGVDVAMVNKVLRGAAPIMLQVFVGVGLVLVLLGRARGFNPSREMVGWSTACIAAVSAHVLLPNVSVNYGILRTFAQTLFWLGPFLAVGSIQSFGWLGRANSLRFAVAAVTTFFLSLTGVISQLLGGYPPQLHLNNAGQYYDIYYVHQQEIAAIRWLENRIGTDSRTAVQSEVATDRYAIKRLENYSVVNTTDDIFPMLIRRQAYAFLGYTAVNKGEVTFLYSGDLVTYEYPVDFLDTYKSLLYSSDSARIYR